MKIKAAVLREFNKPVSIEEVDLAPPKEKEVLIKTAFTGFCHSDLHFLKGTVDFGLPSVIGHEAAGVVEDVVRGEVGTKEKADEQYPHEPEHEEDGYGSQLRPVSKVRHDRKEYRGGDAEI